MVDRRRRRKLVAIGVALALLLWASWLALDRLLPRARATNFARPISTQGGHDPGPATHGRPQGAGSSGVTQAASAHARGDSFGRGGDVGLSSDVLSSYFSDAADYASTEEDAKGGSSAKSSGSIGMGTTTGTAGSGAVSNDSAATLKASSTQYAGAGPGTDVSTSSDALRSGPAVDIGTPFGASVGNGTPPQSGPAPPTAPVNQPRPLDNRQSGPPGGTIGPVISAESSGAGSNAGSDNPGRSVTDWGSGKSGTAAGSDVPPNPVAVPVPPSLLLFGASALMLWVASRVRRGPQRSRREPPLIG